MANTMMGMTGRFLCNIKSGNLHFCCIYYWCLSQKAHKHFAVIFFFCLVFISNMKRYQHWNRNHPSLPDPSPVDGERNVTRIKVQGCMIRSSFVTRGLLSIERLPMSPDFRIEFSPRLPKQYRYVPRQRRTALFTKHQGISPYPSSPRCRNTTLVTRKAAVNITVSLHSGKLAQTKASRK